MSLHSDAVRALRDWVPPSTSQAGLRDRYLAHLAAHPDGLSRECRPDHLTASTLVLSHDRRRVLLTLHAKAERWFQFGGHCEPGDATLAAAARREVVEESGLAGLRMAPTPVHLSEHAVPFCGPAGDVHHLDVRFVAVAPQIAEHTISEESLDVRWWPADALPDPEPELMELVRLAQSTSSGGASTWAAADQPSR